MNCLFSLLAVIMFYFEVNISTEVKFCLQVVGKFPYGHVIYTNGLMVFQMFDRPIW